MSTQHTRRPPRARSLARRSGLLALVTAASLTSGPVVAQSMTCGNAVNQLQHYIGQVNAMANAEYYQNIPLRCGGEPNCMQWWLYQLNSWYAQQTNYVNGWYQQIATQCSQERAPRLDRGNIESGGIDPGQVEDLEVDDEDQTVRIRIPENPTGFRPRGRRSR